MKKAMTQKAEVNYEKQLFEESSVFSALMRLAVPTVASQIILVIYNMADTFFIGLTGDDAMLTAATVCMPAFMFLSAFANLFGVGAASVISRALGREDEEYAGRTAAFAFWGCLLVTALYSAGVMLFLHPYVNLLGGTSIKVHQHACRYMICTVVIGGEAASMNMLLAHLIRSEGHSLPSSIGIALGGIMNIVLDPFFMFVIFQPGQEVLGAAVATALSNVIALAFLIIVVIVRRRGHCVLRFSPQGAMLQNHIPGQVFSAGIPACIMTLFENISYAVLDKLISVCGTSMQAGIGVAKKVNMLSHCMVRGITQGALPLIGYNYAAGNIGRMKKAVRLANILAIGVAFAASAVFIVFAREMIGIFISHQSASRDYGVEFLRILSIGAPFSACAYTFISFFQAVGEGRKSFSLAVLRKGFVDIPMMFVIAYVLTPGKIVWATPVTDMICCAFSIVMYFGFVAQFRREHTGYMHETRMNAL